jgi:hypothetical protein
MSRILSDLLFISSAEAGALSNRISEEDPVPDAPDLAPDPE